MFTTTPTPDGRSYGTEDNSRIPAVAEPKQDSNTMEYVHILAERGRGEATIVTSAPGILYGNNSFKKGSKYFTHSNLFLNMQAATGAPSLVKRVLPEGCTKALLRFSLESIPTDQPLYERAPDGSIKIVIDPITGEETKVSSGVIPGTRLVLHVGVSAYPEADRGFAAGTIVADYRDGSVKVGTRFLGEITRADGAKEHPKSTLRPIFDILVDSEGSYGNHAGVRISSPTTNQDNPVVIDNVIKNKSFPIRLSVVERDQSNMTSRTIPLISGDLAQDLYVRPNATDFIAEAPISLSKKFVQSYTREATASLTPIWPTFGGIHVYEDNIVALQSMLAGGYLYTDADGGEIEIHGEGQYDDEAMDYGRDQDQALSVPNNAGLLNILTTRQVNGVPYFASDISESLMWGGVVADETAVHYASGGSDGLWHLRDGSPAELLNLKLFDAAVAASFQNFGAKPDTLKDILRYPFSKVTDTGFSVETKLSMDRVIKERPDVNLDIGAFSVAGPGAVETDIGLVYRDVPGTDPVMTDSKTLLNKWRFTPRLTAEEDTALSVKLRTHFAMVPESIFFGTPVMRVCVFGESGNDVNDLYEHFLPGSIDRSIARNLWTGVSGYSVADDFTEDDLRKPRFLKNLTYNYRDTISADKSWDAGLNFTRAHDAYDLFWPAIQTIYMHKDSVLSSAKFSSVASHLHRIGMYVWRDISGESRTDLQFEQELVDSANREITKAGFPPEFLIRPEAILTDADKARGYSGYLKFHVGAPAMRTKLTYSVHGYRTEQLMERMQGMAL